jgi:hypothetical protein
VVELVIALAIEDALLVEPERQTNGRIHQLTIKKERHQSYYSVEVTCCSTNEAYIQSWLAATATDTGCWAKADARARSEP